MNSLEQTLDVREDGKYPTKTRGRKLDSESHKWEGQQNSSHYTSMPKGQDKSGVKRGERWVAEDDPKYSGRATQEKPEERQTRRRTRLNQCRHRVSLTCDDSKGVDKESAKLLLLPQLKQQDYY